MGAHLGALRRAGGSTLLIFTGIISVYPLIAAHMPGFLEGAGFSFTEAAKFHVMSRESIIGIPTRTFCELVIGFMLFQLSLTSNWRRIVFYKICFRNSRGSEGRTGKGIGCGKRLIWDYKWKRSGKCRSRRLDNHTYNEKNRLFASCFCRGSLCLYRGRYHAPSDGSCCLCHGELSSSSLYGSCYCSCSTGHSLLLRSFCSDRLSCSHGLVGLPKGELPSLKETLKEGWIYFAALTVLVYLLFKLKQEAQAPYIASVFLLLGAMFRKETRPDLKTIYNLFIDSGRILVEMIAILSGIGFILGGMSMTGVAVSFSSELVNLFGQHALPMLMMGMVVSYILGMGMTITACYIMLSIVLVPALSPLGFDPVAVHLFVLYCGLFSFITPPVAMAAYVAAIIGGANFWKTGFQAMRLCFVLYVIPFSFCI